MEGKENVDISRWVVGEPFEWPLHKGSTQSRKTRTRPYPEVNSQRHNSSNRPLSPVLSPKSCLEEISPTSNTLDRPSSPVLCLGGNSDSEISSLPLETLQGDGASFMFNYGSESESEDSGDDEELLLTPVPRTYQRMTETLERDDPNETIQMERPPGGSAVHQPSINLNFNWTPFPNPPVLPELRRETFSKSNVGPTTPCVDPYDSFTAIWDQEFMEHIVEVTNEFAQERAQHLIDNNIHHNSKNKKWVDTNVHELYTYFALLLAMDVVVKFNFQEYWSADSDVFCTPGFRAHMSLKRFKMLKKHIHFNRNENMRVLQLNASETELYQVLPVVEHLNSKFQTLYNLGQNIALDESLLQRKGWLDTNQTILNKSTSVGFRTYEVWESQTGYLWRFEIHGHNEFVPQEEGVFELYTQSIVLRLLHGLEKNGHTVWMDSFFNSPALARRLKSFGFDCVGTFKTNRQFVPEALRQLSKIQMLGDSIIGFTSGDVDVMVWRDLKKIGLISTYHGNYTALANGVFKPILLCDYNIMMGGVDKKDRLLAIENKKTRMYYKKCFRRLLNVSVLNSHILFKQSSSSSITDRSFKIDLIKSLFEKHSSAYVAPELPRGSLDIKLHYADEYPLLSGKGYHVRRHCTVCKKKRVRTFCHGCNKAACLYPCFRYLH